MVIDMSLGTTSFAGSKDGCFFCTQLRAAAMQCCHRVGLLLYTKQLQWDAVPVIVLLVVTWSGGAFAAELRWSATCRAVPAWPAAGKTFPETERRSSAFAHMLSSCLPQIRMSHLCISPLVLCTSLWRFVQSCGQMMMTDSS